jgi:hypothetical protein
MTRDFLAEAGIKALQDLAATAPKAESPPDPASFKHPVGNGAHQDLPRHTPPDEEGPLGPEPPPHDGHRGPGRQGQAAEKPFPFTTFVDIDPSPHKIRLIEDILGAGEMSGWYGAPGSGKSVAISDAACHVAAGKTWGGKRILQRGAVLYVAAERGGLVKRRMVAWRKHHKIDDIPLAVVDGMLDLRTSKVDANRIIATAKKVAEKFGCEVVWIIIDTLNRVLAGGDENGSKDMGMLINSCTLIQTGTGAHVSLVHHVPIDSPDRMRGHSSMLGALDTTIRITKPDGNVLIEVDKENDSINPARLSFQFEDIDLSIDPEIDKKTTAPVLMPIDAPQRASGKKSGKLSKGAQIALRALTEAVDEVGRVPPTSDHVPPKTKVVTMDQWRDYADRRGICSSTNEKPEARDRAMRKVFQSATETLIADRYVGVWTNKVWVV